MTIEILLEFIENSDKRLSEKYNFKDNETKIMAHTIKVSEEFGELCNEVLAHNSMQRSEKLELLDKTNLQKEFADVIFSTLVLAKALNIDVKKALNDRMETISKRLL